MSRISIQLLITISFVLQSPPCRASLQATAADDVTGLFRVLWALLIVLAIMLVLYALMKKRFSIIHPRAGKSIRVVEIQPLMPKKSICLVEVKGREYLLGLGNEEITFLTALDSPHTARFKDVLEKSQWSSDHEADRS